MDRTTQKKINEKQASIKSYTNSLGAKQSEKINLEKRLREVIKIISYMNGSVNDGFTNISNKANSSQAKFESIISQGIFRGNVSNAFKAKNVTSDSNTADALTSLIKEKSNIENDIKTINTAIQNLNNKISDLKIDISRLKR